MTKRKKVYGGLFVAFVVLMVIGSLRGGQRREDWVNELNASRNTDAFSVDGHTLVISRPYCDDDMARGLTPIAESKGFSAVRCR